MADKYIFINNFITTLAAQCLTAATSATLGTISGLSTPPTGYVQLLTFRDPINKTLFEVVKVTAAASNPVTIVRAQEGTTARDWPVGTLVYAGVTDAMMTGLPQGFDDGGDAKGTNATELQRGRDSADRVASGLEAVTAGWNNKASGANSTAVGSDNTASGANSFAAGKGSTASGAESVAVGEGAQATATGAIAVGDGATASGTNAVAQGDGAVASAPSGTAVGVSALAATDGTYADWTASTAISFTSIRQRTTGDYLLYCLSSGTTGVSEPAESMGVVIDGTVVWLVVGNATWDGATAVGRSARALGNGATAVGDGSRAFGLGAAAIGHDSRAVGVKATAINGAALAEGAVSIGSTGEPPVFRDAKKYIQIGSQKYPSFQYAKHIAGLEYIDQHDWIYTGSADLAESMRQTTAEVTFYSIPVQLGDAGWPGATQTVKHGQSIREGSYIYTAYIYGDDYFDDGVTGGSEPTWPTTPGDDVSDGDVSWICVDPADISRLLPDLSRFTPTSVGVIAKWSTPGGAVTYPQLTFGISGDLDSWLAATTFNKLTGDNSSHFVDPTLTIGAKQFGAALTTPGTDLDCTAVIVIKGFVIESQVA